MAIPATTTEPRLRHEEKHQVNLREALVLSRRLEKLFPRDPHAGPEGSYQVVSLYYDDPYDTALRQKLDGVNRREKFRLRYYGEEPAFFKLEKKYKVELPIIDVVLELNKFAFMAMDNPGIQRWEYQKGPLHGYGSVEAAVYAQQDGHCMYNHKIVTFRESHVGRTN